MENLCPVIHTSDGMHDVFGNLLAHVVISEARFHGVTDEQTHLKDRSAFDNLRDFDSRLGHVAWVRSASLNTGCGRDNDFRACHPGCAVVHDRNRNNLLGAGQSNPGVYLGPSGSRSQREAGNNRSGVLFRKNMNLSYMGLWRHRTLDPDPQPDGMATFGQGRQSKRDAADLGHDPSGRLANERRELLGKRVCRTRLSERHEQAAQAAKQTDEHAPP